MGKGKRTPRNENILHDDKDTEVFGVNNAGGRGVGSKGLITKIIIIIIKHAMKSKVLRLYFDKIKSIIRCGSLNSYTRKEFFRARAPRLRNSLPSGGDFTSTKKLMHPSHPTNQWHNKSRLSLIGRGFAPNAWCQG